eukprot:SAG22_NODE_3467_length_1693_cov_1.146801_1_plen_198_part_10
MVLRSVLSWLRSVLAPPRFFARGLAPSLLGRRPEKLKKYDIVLTTYGSLLTHGGQAALRGFKNDYEAYSYMREVVKHVLFNIEWRRIILDEAHFIKNHNCESARACRLLDGQRRWCITGTPIQNSADDLLALFMFLKYAPFSSAQKFHEVIGGGKKKDASESRPLKIKKLQAILGPVILRRRKDTKFNGRPIVQLPPK